MKRQPRELTPFDHWMIRLAADRAPVQLDDGRTARLVAWKPMVGQTRPHRRNKDVRVEFPSLRQATLPIRRVAGILGDDGVLYPIHSEGGGRDQDLGEGVLDPGGGRGRRDHLPGARLLAADGGGEAADGRPAGVGAPTQLHGAGGAGVDRSGDAVPVGTLDHQGHEGRSAVGHSTGKGDLP